MAVSARTSTETVHNAWTTKGSHEIIYVKICYRKNHVVGWYLIALQILQKIEFYLTQTQELIFSKKVKNILYLRAKQDFPFQLFTFTISLKKKFYIVFLSQTFQCFESETLSIWNVQFCIYVIFCFFNVIRNYRSLKSSLAASMSLLHSFYSTKP